MKLPRYKQAAFSQGAGRRSLTAGLQQGPTAGQQIAKTVQNFIQQKIEFDLKMNKIQFKSNAKQYNAEVGDAILSFTTDIETRDDTENFDPEFQSLVTSLESGAKQKFGDGFERYQGDFQQAVLLGRSSYEKVKRKKIIAVAQNTSLKDDSSWNTNIFNFKNPLLISQEFEIRRKLIEDEGKEGLFSPDETKQRLDNSRQQANIATIQKQIGNFGDLDKQLQNLQNREFKLFDVNGVELPLNHPLRQAIITEKLGRRNANEQYQKELQAKSMNEETERLQAAINVHKVLQPNPNITKEILDAPIDASIKKQLLDQLKEERVDLSDSSKGKNINRMVDVLIESGLIDTESEASEFISKYHLAEEGSYIKDYVSKMKRFRELRGKRESYKQSILDEALGVIGSQVGPNTIPIFQTVLGGGEKGAKAKQKFIDALSTQDPKEQEQKILAYEAANNLRNLVSIGQKNGLSIESMVQDVTSPNYIVNKVVSSYLQKIQNLETEDLKNRIDVLKQGTRVFGISPEDFKKDIEQGVFIKSTATRDINLPPIGDLSPADYINKHPQYFFGTKRESFNPEFETKDYQTNTTQ
jgi:hypothetical protein